MAVQLSLGQLLVPVNETDALASVLATLQSFGFQATSWQPGSVQRTMVQTIAKVYSDLTFTVADIASSGFIKLAKGQYAKLSAQYQYGLIPIAATPTIGQMVLTSSAGAPLNTWVDGGVLIADQPPGTLGANVFRVQGLGSIGPGAAQVTINVSADIPGSAANIAPGVPLYLWTALTGVTVTNPSIIGTSSWITTPGTDDETVSRLADRCVGRFDTLTYANTDGAYRAWALAALPALTRVAIPPTPGDGTVLIIGATALGGLTGAQITTIANYIQGVTDGVGRRPINDVVTVASANVNSGTPVTMTVTCASQYASDVAARITSALIALFGAMPIGGKIIAGTTVGRVLLADLYATVMSQTGVINVAFASPTADVILAQYDIFNPAISVTVLPV
jgi:uncharacterized phage protein gp47/JayE